MAVTPVGLNQNVYMGQQVATQPVQQAAPVSQPIPVGQPAPAVQTVPAQGNTAYPVYYPTNPVNNLPQSTNDYSNDIFMPGIDFEKEARDLGLIPPQDSTTSVQDSAQVQPQPQQPAAVQPNQVPPQQVPQQQVVQPAGNAQQLAFTSNPFQVQQDKDNLANYLVTPDEAKVGAEKKFKLGPAIGTAAGFVAPFICNKARLGKVFTKDLLVKVPVMTTGGLCAGGIAEGLAASAKKLGAENAEAEITAPAKMDAKA